MISLRDEGPTEGGLRFDLLSLWERKWGIEKNLSRDPCVPVALCFLGDDEEAEGNFRFGCICCAHKLFRPSSKLNHVAV